MALYAFDGTGDFDQDDDGLDTNVIKMAELYLPQDQVIYTSGVGTRKGPIGHVFGGLFGAGGRSRIDEMYDAVCERWLSGDQTIDVVGFSRGAALAIHFANKLAQDGILLENDRAVDAKIRFLGLFDTVASFGLSFNNILNFQEINIGWDVTSIPDIVERAAHAMALDERREAFNITRPAGNIEEVWFRGVHGDIGGGNKNPARSNIALHWMMDKARNAGLSFDSERAQGDKYSVVNIHAPVMENRDLFTDPPRQIQPQDAFDSSVLPELQHAGDSVSAMVDSRFKYNFSGVALELGVTYRVTATGQWTDGGIHCDAAGWDTEEELGWAKEKIVKAFEDNRRCPDANWFELIGCYGTEDTHLVRLGEAVNGMEFTAQKSGDFWLFANDLNWKYGNNEGSVEVTITRVD